ncbi:MAG: hypothetical protein Q9Q40_14560 [Acidobacteriota bacterium]|nr:hypothetical protein [Acidobacteriota bacterium]
MFDMRGLLVVVFAGFGAALSLFFIPVFWLFDAMSYAWLAPAAGLVLGGLVGRELER